VCIVVLEWFDVSSTKFLLHLVDNVKPVTEIGDIKIVAIFHFSFVGWDIILSTPYTGH
jgi:hypothetical protein